MGNRMNITNYIPLFLKGSYVTLAAWFCAGTGSLLIGTLLGILSAESIGRKKTIVVIKLYTFISKGIPAYVQILIAYFIIPDLIGINVSGFLAGTCALALCSSGYVTEIVRTQINAISLGQWDACFVLGYTRPQTLKRIILPQVFKISLPTLIGELEQLLKSSSLLATIGVTELTRVGMNVISRELNPMPIYLTIAALYLCFSALLYAANSILKKRTLS